MSTQASARDDSTGFCFDFGLKAGEECTSGLGAGTRAASGVAPNSKQLDDASVKRLRFSLTSLPQLLEQHASADQPAPFTQAAACECKGSAADASERDNHRVAGTPLQLLKTPVAALPQDSAPLADPIAAPEPRSPTSSVHLPDGLVTLLASTSSETIPAASLAARTDSIDETHVSAFPLYHACAVAPQTLVNKMTVGCEVASKHDKPSRGTRRCRRGQAAAGLRDIVPEVYLGGLKVWSCAPDVARYALFGLPAAAPSTSAQPHTSGTTEFQVAGSNLIKGRFRHFLELVAMGRELKVQVAIGAPSQPPTFRVLELGCGHAMPAIASLRACWDAWSAEENSSMPLATARVNASTFRLDLLLQDYNAEVIDVCAVPNVVTNVSRWFARFDELEGAKDAREMERAVMIGTVAGDWDCLGQGAWSSAGSGEAQGVISDHVQRGVAAVFGADSSSCQASEPAAFANGADIILGADVTYDAEACEKLLRCVVRLLRPACAGSARPSGIAIISTKDYYFGTHGGLEAMRRAIHQHCLPLVLRVLRQEGTGNLSRVLVSVSWSEAG